MDMTRLGQKMTNRSDMHSGVRNATALLQQEVGQAGRVSLPGPVSLTGTTVGNGVVSTVGVNDTEGMFVGEHLIVGTGATEETVTLAAVDTGADTITATLRSPSLSAHAWRRPEDICRRHSDDDGQRIDRQRAEDYRRRQWRWPHGLRRYTCDLANGLCLERHAV